MKTNNEKGHITKTAERIRKTGIDIIGDAPWGTHFCQFYQTKEDLLDILVPYFKAGLENNEFCMWVTSEPLSEEEAKKEMRKAVPNFDQHLRSGQIEIVPHTDWYLKDGAFNLQRVLNAWTDKLNFALAKGYDGIRVTGNTAWLEKRDWKNFADYEEQVNSVIGKYRMMSICSYSLDKCGASELIDVVKNHQFALIRREGEWTPIESSERKLAEENLRQSENKYRTLVENLPQKIFLKDKNSVYVSCNENYARDLKIKPEEIAGKTDYDFHPRELAEKYRSDDQRIVRSGNTEDIEEIYIQNGRELWVHTVKTAVKDEKGQCVGLLGIFRDITERKRMEETLRQSEENFKALAENANDGILIGTGEEGWHVYANRRAVEITGYPIQELLKTRIRDLAHPDELPKLTERYQKRLAGLKVPKPYETALVNKDGIKVPIEISPSRTVWQNQLADMVIFRDITERKRAEEALQVSHHFIEIANRHTEMTSLLQEFVVEVQNFTGAAAVGLRILDEKGNILYQAYEGFSREFYELESPLSTKSDQCMCINVIKGVTDPNLPFYTEGGSFYMNGTTRFLASVSEEEKGRTRNACNRFGYESVALVPIRLGERILGLMHVADSHENMFPLEMVKALEGAAMQVGIAIQRVRSEEEIRKKNKELEAFVYMVSHDLKNPVVSIQGFCSSILKNQRDELNEKTLFYLQRVQANASLMSSLLEDLVELSRIGRIEDKKTEISVQQVIKSVWAGVSTSLATQDVEFILPKNLPQVLYSEKRLYQIFSNLLSNALKFRDEDRKTKVEIGHQEDKDNYTFFVRDNGIGIEQKYHNKIFESFSQLKDTKSEGTGMGLAIVKKIVEANQGKVWVESQKKAGSTFYFTIPKNV